MKTNSKAIIKAMEAMRDDTQAAHLMRFFKTGKGDYGEGDLFLGIRVPDTRAVVAQWKNRVTLEDIPPLLDSRWHEIRLAGFLLLIELYKKAKKQDAGQPIVDFYLSSLHRGNNWDLVDLVAPKILGDYLTDRPEEREILYSLASMDGHLWHQRVAIVATWALIREHDFNDALTLSEGLMVHPHDLIHKACGWMLREVGKRGGMNRLEEFLNRYADRMPRTMLRYAIEKMPEERRRYYMRHSGT